MRVRDLRFKEGDDVVCAENWEYSQDLRSIRNPNERYRVYHLLNGVIYSIDRIKDDGRVRGNYMHSLDKLELAVVITDMTEVT